LNAQHNPIVNGSDPKKRDQEDGKKGDSGTMPVKVGLQSLANWSNLMHGVSWLM
jgi:hypothetical protein